jgi:hypothetical protein
VSTLPSRDGVRRALGAALLLVVAGLGACDSGTPATVEPSQDESEVVPAEKLAAAEPPAPAEQAPRPEPPPLPAPGGILSTPLIPRAPSAGATLFERLPAERTGIDFRNEWARQGGSSHELNSAASGGGVAVGDADGDGRPDVLLTRFLGSTRLYRNLGDFRFEDVTEAAGLGADSSGGGATFADLDGDGDQDLSVCSHGKANRLYENLGAGRFRERAAEAGLDFLGASINVAFADVDLDGDLDAFLLTNRFSTHDEVDPELPLRDGRPYVPEELAELYDLLIDPVGRPKKIQAGQRDHLYLNDGGGTFTEVTEASGIHGNHYGLSAIFWDPDGDLWPDLYVANDFWGPDRLYRNRRDGSFDEVAAQALPRTPWFSMGSDSGDVDNDGRSDYLASDMSPMTHAKRLTNMGDVWESRWFLHHSQPNQSVRNALYLNTGTPRFLEASHLAGLSSSEWTWSAQFGDLDADGLLDLFVSNGMTRNYFDSDLRREADAYVGADQTAFWDRTGPLLDTNLAFRNLGGLAFESAGEAWGLDQASASFGATLADLDGDGDLDALVNNFEDAPFLLRNGSTDGHVLMLRLVGHHSPRDGVGATVTITTPADDPARSHTGLQTRYVSLTHGYLGGVEPRAHFGLGRHASVETLTVRWPSGHVQRFADLAADQLHVIAEPDGPPPPRVDPARPEPLFTTVEGPVSTEARYDAFKHQPLLPWNLSTLGPGLACGDVDGDGDEDVWLGGPAGLAGSVLFNDDGQLAARPQPVLDLDDFYEDMGGLLLDLDADGVLDLYVASGGAESKPGSWALRDRLYLGVGDGTFARAPKTSLPDLRESSSAVAAADVDRDGDLDLVVGGGTLQGAYPLAPSSRLLRNTAGVFDDATVALAPALSAAGMVSGALFSDVDDDGHQDLVLTTHWGPVRLLRGTGEGLEEITEAAGLSALTGFWNGVVSGDVDGDGDLDLVVTNLGLNTPYRANPDEPLSLYSGDVDGSGAAGLLESTWADGEEVPLRCLHCVRQAMPFVGAGFETHAEYAGSTLAQVYGDDVLAGLEQRAVTELRTGLLRNDGAGVFGFEPLPALAQVAPCFGPALCEVDGDGVLDLVLAQNFSGGHFETGRWNGGLGLLLRGDGAGGFTPVPADASGVAIPDDARAVLTADLDGDGREDLAVSCSDAPLRLLVRDEAAATPALSLRLQGPPGNPTAVGARVRVKTRNGVTHVAEVTAGGGYLAQSSATLVLAVPRSEVAAIHVRWPDGGTTEHVVPDGQGDGNVVVLARD